VTSRPLSVIVTSVFILGNMLIWLGLGVIIAAQLHPALNVPASMHWIMAFLSVALTGILLGLYIFLYKGNRAAYYFTLAFFAFTAVLTIFDDVGLSDLVVLVINLIPLILLIKDRAFYRARVKPAQ
jgi:lysylphosphatidylglycerol synthetase-like protein (DUF2156 family)